MIHKNDLVSVVIPCYNHANFLGEAIESVLAQTYSHFEIIVVDDGSTDNTAEIAAAYRVAQCLRQSNQGLSAARNAGIRNSNGKYLVLLDADDRLLPNALQSGIDAFDRQPECGFVSGHVQNVADDGSPISTPETNCGESDHYRLFLQSCYIRTTGAVMFRSTIFQSGELYNPALVAVADLDLYLRMSRKFPVTCHHQVVIQYRKRPDSMSRDAALMLRESLAVLHSQRKYVKDNPTLMTSYQIGLKTTERHYGDRLMQQIHRGIRHSQWKTVIRDLFVLLIHAPRRLVHAILPG
jgi:Glycosyltransferases involved in cell wall biogenesis